MNYPRPQSNAQEGVPEEATTNAHVQSTDYTPRPSSPHPFLRSHSHHPIESSANHSGDSPRPSVHFDTYASLYDQQALLNRQFARVSLNDANQPAQRLPEVTERPPAPYLHQFTTQPAHVPPPSLPTPMFHLPRGVTELVNRDNLTGRPNNANVPQSPFRSSPWEQQNGRPRQFVHRPALSPLRSSPFHMPPHPLSPSSYHMRLYTPAPPSYYVRPYTSSPSSYYMPPYTPSSSSYHRHPPLPPPYSSPRGHHTSSSPSTPTPSYTDGPPAYSPCTLPAYSSPTRSTCSLSTLSAYSSPTLSATLSSLSLPAREYTPAPLPAPHPNMLPHYPNPPPSPYRSARQLPPPQTPSLTPRRRPRSPTPEPRSRVPVARVRTELHERERERRRLSPESYARLTARREALELARRRERVEHERREAVEHARRREAFESVRRWEAFERVFGEEKDDEDDKEDEEEEEEEEEPAGEDGPDNDDDEEDEEEEGEAIPSPPPPPPPPPSSPQGRLVYREVDLGFQGAEDEEERGWGWDVVYE